MSRKQLLAKYMEAEGFGNYLLFYQAVRNFEQSDKYAGLNWNLFDDPIMFVSSLLGSELPTRFTKSGLDRTPLTNSNSCLTYAFVN